MPYEVYRDGHTNAAALLIGHTSFDGTAAFYSTAPLANATEAEWEPAMRHRFGRHAKAVMAQYPLSRFRALGVPPVTTSYIAADADQRVACPTRTIALLAARAAERAAERAATAAVEAGSVRGSLTGVFTFVFSHLQLNCDVGFELSALPWWGDRARLAASGWASHGSDVKFVFNTVGAELAAARARAHRRRGWMGGWGRALVGQPVCVRAQASKHLPICGPVLLYTHHRPRPRVSGAAPTLYSSSAHARVLAVARPGQLLARAAWGPGGAEAVPKGCV